MASIFRVVERSLNETTTQWEDPQEFDEFESLCEWEDITDDYGIPEQIGPGLWIVRSERDKPHHNIKHGDPIVVIFEVHR